MNPPALDRIFYAAQLQKDPYIIAHIHFIGSPSRTNTHEAPILLLSPLPPTMAVLPLADNATDQPCPELADCPFPN